MNNLDGGKTGWPPGLLQDDCKGLSRWFASRLDAREVLRRNLQPERNQCDGCARGLPTSNGIHYGDQSWDLIACTANMYRRETE